MRTYITPVNGKKIPHPTRGGFLSEEGDTVDLNEAYWQRRLADGDIQESAAPAAEKTEKK